MSKIGRVALEAQEEVLNPLGYSTIDEAIADGWGSAEWMAARESEQDKAHEVWLKEKEKLLALLENAVDHNDECYESKFINFALREAIEFVKGVSHE